MVKRTRSRTSDPLQYTEKIINPDGTPTKEFMRKWLQSRNFDTSNITTTEELVAAVTALQGQIDNQIIAGTALDGGGSLKDGDVTIDHADSGVTAGEYGDATHVAQITVDDQGHVTDVVEVAISGGGGGVSPFWDTTPTPPTVSGTGATLIQGVAATSVLTDVSRGIEFEITAAGAGTDRNSLMQITAPGSTYTMTFLVQRNYPFAVFHNCGPFLKDNTTGRIVAYTIGNEANNQLPRLRRLRYTNITTFSASDSTVECGGVQNPLWMRLEVQATNCIFSISYDGVNFIPIMTESKTAWTATPDRCGFWFSTNPSEPPVSVPLQVLLMSWDIV